MARGAFLGLTTVDILNYVKKYPGRNEKISADEQLILAGGPATNAAVAFSSFGVEAHLVSGLGVTPLAGIVRGDLNRHSVQHEDIAINPEMRPVVSAITIDGETGDRSVVYTSTEADTVRWRDDLAQLFRESDILMLDGYHIPVGLKAASIASELKIPVILDGGSWKAGLDKLLPYVDFAIVSDNFSPPGCVHCNEMLSYLQAHGVRHIAVSRGASPILAWSEGMLTEIDVLSVQAVDTLGAGDILHGAFCHYILGNDFVGSLRKAAATASRSCLFRGTREWIASSRSGS